MGHYAPRQKVGESTPSAKITSEDKQREEYFIRREALRLEGPVPLERLALDEAQEDYLVASASLAKVRHLGPHSLIFQETKKDYQMALRRLNAARCAAAGPAGVGRLI
jgi:hypothetical protein